MALYYYARKLQKGAKVSQPCSTSSAGGRSNSASRSTDYKQEIPPPPPLRSSTGVGHSHGHCCCQAQQTTCPCANYSHPHHHHPSNQQHIKMNGGIDVHHFQQHLDLNQQRPFTHHHPPQPPTSFPSSIPKSESKYENLLKGSASTHYDEDEECGAEFEYDDPVDKDQGKQGENSNSQNRLRIKHNSATTLVEDVCQHEYHSPPGRANPADDDLDKEIQEIYDGKRVSNSGASFAYTFTENYQRSPQNRMQEQQIVKEEETDYSLCYNKKGQLISGSWESLLEKMLPSESQPLFPDEDVYAFLLCSRLYQPPHLTISAVFKHFSCKDKPGSNGTHQKEEYQDQEDLDSAGVLNCEEFAGAVGRAEEEFNLVKDKLYLLVKFLKLWTEWLPQDFRDDRLMHFVRILTRDCVDEDPEVREEISELLDNLQTKLSALQLFQITLRRYKTESSIGEPIAAPSVVTICPNPSTMSEQLCLVELEHFSFIGSNELIAQLLRKERNKTKDCSQMNCLPSSRSGTLIKCNTIGTTSDMDTSGRLPRSSATCCGALSLVTAIEADTDTENLDAFIAWFRRLAMFVASEICKMSKKKARCRVIEYWVQVGKECLKIRNFNSLMAILAGLSCRPVARLKKTWSKINCGDLSELQTAMDPKNNFFAYRAMYKASVWKSLSLPEGEGHNFTILVPYFALLLRDVYNLNSVYPSRIKSNGHINFEKYTEMAKLLKEIMSWQSISCAFVKIPSVFNAVQCHPVYTEQEMTSASYGCESPLGSAEKEHFNRLKRDHGHLASTLFSLGKSSSHYLI